MGLICGVVIAIIYIILNGASTYLITTPAVKSYENQIVQYNAENSNTNFYYSDGSQHVPPFPMPPTEFYIAMGLVLLSCVIVLAGFFLTGILAIKFGGQAAYPLKDVALMGVISGFAAFVPTFIAVLIISIIGVIIDLTSVNSNTPGSTSVLTSITGPLENTCCCLVVSIIASVVLALIGALIYALITHKVQKSAPTA